MSSTEAVVFKTPPAGPEAPQQAVADQSRPAWLPENFKTAEDLAKSYQESQSTIGKLQAEIAEFRKGQPQQPAIQSSPTDPAQGQPAGDQAEVRSVLAAAGIDFTALNDEFSKSGKLSEASYDKLQKAGFPKELVDRHIEMSAREAEATTSAIITKIGGADEFRKMAEWASTGLTKEQIDSYEASIASGDVSRMEQATIWLKGEYEKSNGREPELISGERVGADSSVYQDQSQWIADVRNPLYQTSEAFRVKVAEKLARSPLVA